MKAEQWRIITDKPADGSWNMAVDRALLESAETNLCKPTLRLYGWDRPTLSTGYSQSVDDNIDMAYLERHDIPKVQRPTGGGAILHGDEVTYAVIVPASSVYYGSLSEVYRFVAVAIRTVLASLGINADSEGEKFGVKHSTCCFASRTRHEIACKGRKIVGSAQRRLKHSALQHGSIVLNQDRERYLSCFKWRDETERTKANARLGGVNDFAHEPVLETDFRISIIQTFKKLYDINFAHENLTEKERRHAESIAGVERKLSEVI